MTGDPERTTDIASDAMGSILLWLNRVATVVFGLGAVGLLIVLIRGTDSTGRFVLQLVLSLVGFAVAAPRSRRKHWVGYSLAPPD